MTQRSVLVLVADEVDARRNGLTLQRRGLYGRRPDGARFKVHSIRLGLRAIAGIHGRDGWSVELSRYVEVEPPAGLLAECEVRGLVVSTLIPSPLAMVDPMPAPPAAPPVEAQSLGIALVGPWLADAPVLGQLDGLADKLDELAQDTGGALTTARADYLQAGVFGAAWLLRQVAAELAPRRAPVRRAWRSWGGGCPACGSSVLVFSRSDVAEGLAGVGDPWRCEHCCLFGDVDGDESGGWLELDSHAEDLMDRMRREVEAELEASDV